MFYTRKGDDGTSGLFNFKDRFQKDSPIYDALGSVDELNSLLGVLRARTSSVKTLSVSNELFTIQNCLFIVQAELAGADKKLSKRNVEDLETTIGRIEFYIENPNSFIVPGATVESALYDYARSVARRAERNNLFKISKRAFTRNLRLY